MMLWLTQNFCAGGGGGGVGHLFFGVTGCYVAGTAASGLRGSRAPPRFCALFLNARAALGLPGPLVQYFVKWAHSSNCAAELVCVSILIGGRFFRSPSRDVPIYPLLHPTPDRNLGTVANKDVSHRSPW